MRWIKKFAQDHIYIFSFIVTFLAMMLLFISYSLLSKTTRLNYDLTGILTYLIPFIFIFGVLLILGNINSIKFRKEGIGKGILFGWLFIIVGVYNFMLSSVNFVKSSISFPSIEKIVFYTLIMFCIGIFEEVLFRGIILNNMLNKWGDNKTGIIKSVVLSSLIFGLGHFVNLVVFPALIIRTISQIVYTSLHGILYAGIYLRSKNIWAVIILHAVFDWLVLISGILRPVDSAIAPVDVSIVSGLIEVIFAIPFAFVGFFLIRKVFIEDIPQSEISVKSM